MQLRYGVLEKSNFLNRYAPASVAPFSGTVALMRGSGPNLVWYTIRLDWISRFGTYAAPSLPKRSRTNPQAPNLDIYWSIRPNPQTRDSMAKPPLVFGAVLIVKVWKALFISFKGSVPLLLNPARPNLFFHHPIPLFIIIIHPNRTTYLLLLISLIIFSLPCHQ